MVPTDCCKLLLGRGMQVLAVLDWELATLGNPLSDLAYVCLVSACHTPRAGDATNAQL
jgi:aminoglycoside phosphotransferase (APT) family kinase protein